MINAFCTNPAISGDPASTSVFLTKMQQSCSPCRPWYSHTMTASMHAWAANLVSVSSRRARLTCLRGQSFTGLFAASHTFEWHVSQYPFYRCLFDKCQSPGYEVIREWCWKDHSWDRGRSEKSALQQFWDAVTFQRDGMLSEVIGISICRRKCSTYVNEG